MPRRIRKGAQVEIAIEDAFPGAAGYTPYVVTKVHRDGTVDVALRDHHPDRPVARRVPARNLHRID